MLIMKGGTITDNRADDTAGAIYCDSSGTFSIENVTIANNTAVNNGGAMNLHMEQNSYIGNTEISGNRTEDGNGGAIRMQENGKTLTIKGAKIQGNTASDNGGGIFAESGILEIIGCELTGNSATDGGAIYNDGCTITVCADGQTPTLLDTNIASGSGGGVCLYDGKSVITADFRNNKASANGGAVFIDEGAEAVLDGGNYTGNSAFLEGGGVYVGDSSGSIVLQGAISFSDGT